VLTTDESFTAYNDHGTLLVGDISCIFIFALVFWQEVSSQAKVTRSPVESLQIHDTYIVHFKDNITTEQLQHFAKLLVKKTENKRRFVTEIFQQFFTIKCLTARLSNKAMKWIRVALNYGQYNYLIIEAM